MTLAAEQLKPQLANLPEGDRAELASFLLESLHDQEAAESAWDAELERRLKEIESGAVVGIPAEEVFAELRKDFP